MGRMTPDQLEFYNHLRDTQSKFISHHPSTFPELAHLTTPAERYRNLCESYEPSRFKKERHHATP
jgi:hypothetical protein